MRLMNLNAGCIELEATDDSGVTFRLGSEVSTLTPGEEFVQASTGAVVELRLNDEPVTITTELRLTRKQRRELFRLTYGHPRIDKLRRRNIRKAWRLLYYSDPSLWVMRWCWPGVWRCYR